MPEVMSTGREMKATLAIISGKNSNMWWRNLSAQLVFFSAKAGLNSTPSASASGEPGDIDIVTKAKKNGITYAGSD